MADFDTIAMGGVGAVGQPMDITSDAQKAGMQSPSSGLGSALGGIGNAFQNTIGKMQFNGGKLTNSGGQDKPQQAAAPPAQGDMITQAAALLAKGAISIDQYNKVMAQAGGPGVPTTPPVGGPGQSAPGAALPPDQSAAVPLPTPDPRLGPVSQAWGN